MRYTQVRTRPLTSALIVAYLVIGVVLASSNGYFRDVDGIRDVLSAVLAVGLWPLLLLDVNLRVR